MDLNGERQKEKGKKENINSQPSVLAFYSKKSFELVDLIRWSIIIINLVIYPIETSRYGTKVKKKIAYQQTNNSFLISFICLISKGCRYFNLCLSLL